MHHHIVTVSASPDMIQEINQEMGNGNVFKTRNGREIGNNTEFKTVNNTINIIFQRETISIIRLLHLQHLNGIWIGQDQYRLPLAPLNEFPEPWC